MANIELWKEINIKLNEKNVKLIAVSKTKPKEDILQFYHAGQRIFGENRALELKDKQESLPKDIEWHMIGHLQRNKVKYIAPFVALLHSADSPRLIKEVNKQAKRNERVIDCLLQFHIADEESKYGFSLEAAREYLNSDRYKNLEHVRFCGVMGMATFTDDQAQVRQEFQQLKSIFDSIKSEFFADAPHFKEISMGMSGDYELAIEEGSSMVRIGSMLFGARN